MDWFVQGIYLVRSLLMGKDGFQQFKSRSQKVKSHLKIWSGGIVEVSIDVLYYEWSLLWMSYMVGGGLEKMAFLLG